MNYARLLGISALLGSVICWGVTPVILRRLTEFIDAWTANGVRYPISALLYWPILWHAWRRGGLSWRVVQRCAWPAFFAFSGQVFWALAHYELPASEIGFYVRLSMVWAIVTSVILFPDERALLRRPSFYVGVAMIVLGFLVMTGLGGAEAAVAQEPLIQGGNPQLGLIYILLCGLLFGLYMVSVRLCIPDVDPLISFGVVAHLVSVGTTVGMLAKGDVSLIFVQTPYGWLLLISSSILGIAVGHYLMYSAVHRLGAAITSSCQTLMPFVTAAIASVVLREALTGWQWTGGVVMVVGAVLLLTIEPRKAH